MEILQSQIDQAISEMRNYVKACQKKKKSAGVPIPNDAVKTLATFFQLPTTMSCTTWNKLIDCLDQYDSNWRGYPAPSISRNNFF